MKVLAHRHIGVVVQNFDRMLEFYIGLGFDLRRRDVEEGAFIDGLLGVEKVVLENAKIVLRTADTPDHQCFQIELMNAKDPAKDEGACDPKETFDFMKLPPGVLDLAFTVDDIKSVLEYIVDCGGDVINKPMQSIEGFPALHCYARDPEGNVLHIAENLPQ